MFRLKLVISIMLLTVLGSASYASAESLTAQTVILNRVTFFTIPDGSTVAVAPGPYRLEIAGSGQLRLASLRGSESPAVKAIPIAHPMRLAEPVALATPEAGGGFHVVLLLPDGRGLDAPGTTEAVRTRGVTDPAGEVTSLTSDHLAAAAAQALMTIVLDRAVHFTAVDGSDVNVPPGDYQVEARSQSQLGLVPGGGREPILIQATVAFHQQDIDVPKAEVMAPEADEVHVILSLPGGAALEALGTYSGVRTREPIRAIGRTRALAQAPVAAALAAQSGPVAQAPTTPTVVLSPKNGPSGTMVKVTAYGFSPAWGSTQNMRSADVRLDYVFVQQVTLLPCSSGGLGIGETCGTPPLILKIEGAPGFQRSVRFETSGIFGSSSSTSAIFAIDVAPPVGQTQIPGPAVSLSHSHGPTGTMIEVSACGFPGNLVNSPVIISTDGVPAGKAALFQCRADGATGFNMASMGRTPRTLITVEGQPGPKKIRLDTGINGIPVGETLFTIDPGPPPAYSPRFVLVWGGIAVLDKDSGLIWERAPDRSFAYGWQDGRGLCRAKTVGNHIGWRLPALGELASLIDLSQGKPALPLGHPFFPPPVPSEFWSATLDLDNPQNALGVNVEAGQIFTKPKTQSQVADNWCVWSSRGLDQQ